VTCMELMKWKVDKESKANDLLGKMTTKTKSHSSYSSYFFDDFFDDHDYVDDYDYFDDYDCVDDDYDYFSD